MNVLDNPGKQSGRGQGNSFSDAQGKVSKVAENKQEKGNLVSNEQRLQSQFFFIHVHPRHSAVEENDER